MAKLTKGASKRIDNNYSKFLGIYEASDGDTQMKDGVASVMQNFQVTESYHLKTRPGLIPYAVQGVVHAYYADEARELAVIGSTLYTKKPTEQNWSSLGTVALSADANGAVALRNAPTIFRFGARYYLLSGGKYYGWQEGESAVSEVVGYVPLVVTGADPSGGGTQLERINLLTNKRRAQYSADGESTKFVLPESTPTGATEAAILSVTVGGAAVQWTEGSTVIGGVDYKKAILATAPPQGVNNVEIGYRNLGIDAGANSRSIIEKMRYVEAFNGATDSRLFFYGGGSNVIYYTEPTLSGEVTGAYIPALNEIAIGDSSSPVTGLCRHYGRMMAFKPDCCYAVAYDTITLADGSLTAGFYVRPMHRELGSDAAGQVAVVQNFPRTYCGASLYDWKQTASYYQDERYARIVSEPVQFTLRTAAADKLLLYDDEIRHRFYCFLNDTAGTVLVNAYEQGVWYLYTGFCSVTAVGRAGARLILAMKLGSTAGLYELSDAHSADYEPLSNGTGYNAHAISCRWESGHMDFGKSNMRKYSSYIWVSLAAGRGARAWISARSDRRPEYAEKAAENILTGLFDETDFSDFSFETYEVPRTKRLKIKVKNSSFTSS